MEASERWRPAWFAGVGLGLLASVGFALVPAGTDAATITYQVIAGTVVLVMLVLVTRLPRRHRNVWLAVWGYSAFALAGDVAYYRETLSGVTHASVSHALYFAGYACALIALLLMSRALHPGRDVEAAIDTLIITIALASVVFLTVIDPTIALYAGDTREMLLAIAYPLADLVLLSGLIRVLVGNGPLNPAVVIVLAAFAVTFMADLFYNYVGAGGLDGIVPGWLDALYLAAFVMLAAAASAPGASLGGVEQRVPRDFAPTHRTLALSIGALLVPLLLVVAAVRSDAQAARVLALACVLVILLVLWRFRTLLVIIDRQAQRLSSLARMDALTGLPNRRTLDHLLERLESTPVDSAVTVAMLDLDHFKDYNDAYGHPAGDVVLVACADAWRRRLEDLAPSAVLARYGGEEFAVILPGWDLASAQPLLEELRRSTPPGHTVSIGYAELEPEESVFATLNRADRALYAAKGAGRNRVMASTAVEPGAAP